MKFNNVENFPKYSGIYMIVCLITGKTYIGVSHNLYTRLNTNYPTEIRNKKNNRMIIRAIRKYGVKNFTCIIIDPFEYIDHIELLALELAYIDYFDSANPQKGYNTYLFPNSAKGTHWPKLAKEKISKTRRESGIAKGENNPMFGKHHTQAVKDKQSKLRKSQDLSIWEKPIKQIHKDTNEIIKIWPSKRKAEIGLNLPFHSYLSRAANYKKQAYGFKWEYA
jgi:group I intron endonuclease